MREESSTPEQEMRFATGQPFEPFQQGFVDSFRSELIDQMIIIDGHLYREREGEGKRKREEKAKRQYLVFRTARNSKTENI